MFIIVKTHKTVKLCFKNFLQLFAIVFKFYGCGFHLWNFSVRRTKTSKGIEFKCKIFYLSNFTSLLFDMMVPEIYWTKCRITMHGIQWSIHNFISYNIINFLQIPLKLVVTFGWEFCLVCTFNFILLFFYWHPCFSCLSLQAITAEQLDIQDRWVWKKLPQIFPVDLFCVFIYSGRQNFVPTMNIHLLLW